MCIGAHPTKIRLIFVTLVFLNFLFGFSAVIRAERPRRRIACRKTIFEIAVNFGFAHFVSVLFIRLARILFVILIHKKPPAYRLIRLDKKIAAQLIDFANKF